MTERVILEKGEDYALENGPGTGADQGRFQRMAAAYAIGREVVILVDDALTASPEPGLSAAMRSMHVGLCTQITSLRKLAARFRDPLHISATLKKKIRS